MNRVTYVELDGKKYPLCCSLGAMEEIIRECGSMDQFMELTTQKTDIRTYIKALEILMKYGAARVKRYEDKEVEVLSHEDIMENLNLDDMNNIQIGVWSAISKSYKNEVAGKETDPKKKDGE